MPRFPQLSLQLSKSRGLAGYICGRQLDRSLGSKDSWKKLKRSVESWKATQFCRCWEVAYRFPDNCNAFGEGTGFQRSFAFVDPAVWQAIAARMKALPENGCLLLETSLRGGAHLMQHYLWSTEAPFLFSKHLMWWIYNMWLNIIKPSLINGVLFATCQHYDGFGRC